MRMTDDKRIKYRKFLGYTWSLVSCCASASFSRSAPPVARSASTHCYVRKARLNKSTWWTITQLQLPFDGPLWPFIHSLFFFLSLSLSLSFSLLFFSLSLLQLYKHQDLLSFLVELMPSRVGRLLQADRLARSAYHQITHQVLREVIGLVS